MYDIDGDDLSLYYDGWKSRGSNNMDNPKFRLGETVRLNGDSESGAGTIAEVLGKNTYGIHEYFVKFSHGEKYCFETELARVRHVTIKCECGAATVYGPKVTGLQHALWCPLRKNA